ncbi:maestro heat-like repeat-containing protein family member 1 isoform X4 [Ixodes scapularis]|uniref:maestro heat-like repeat-containing protein family member 1 isoform X4 n=1 Tax=Ixodes scapularis TaxID=6945 RepID=UPI0011616B0C|nr:maestro heat-like repeat-containing protein family member 1 isoform X4 [Ixodes scapularis]XP_040355313.1 maestro heat-like repeat-containing protein family member 1 isoform X4 [Ixodes scapularis]
MAEEMPFQTGGQVDGIVTALIETLGDKQENVCRAVVHSLQVIGNHQPNLVLSCCHRYVCKEPKLSSSHKLLLFSVMHEVCKNSVENLDKTLLMDVCKTTIEEMTQIKDIGTDRERVMCGIVIALGRQHPHETMELMSAKFQPGPMPHPLVLETLAGLALANPFGIMPFLKALLGTMLPMLGAARAEQLKWAMAFALGRFSEAILDYLVNIEKAPDPSVQKASFASEVASASDFLLNNWLQARETKVRAESAVTLGCMAQLLSKAKLEEQLPKLVTSTVALYRKHQDCYPISKGLCLILEAATENKCSSLEQYLEGLVNAIFAQVCNPPDYSEPMSVRNHNESLRCFTVLAPMFPDKLIAFLLMKVENSNEKARIGALTVLKHIINSADMSLDDRMRNITQGLHSVFNDQSNKVKKVLAQVIVALAHHGYLEMEGGHSMIEFLIRQCALPDDTTKRPMDFDYVSNEALRTMCENVLQLLTTTIDNIEKILWPSLFEYLLSEDLTPAVGTLCKCLANFASKKREQSTAVEIDYQKNPGVPRPQALLARLFVMLGDPFAHRNRGVHILRLLRCIPSLVHRDIVALWDTVLPQMALRLEGALDDPESLERESWKEQILELAHKCFQEVDKEDWTISVGGAMQAQLPLYNAYPEDKCTLLQLLGVVMKKVANKQFVNGALDKIFEHVNHTHPEEREGCAVAVGYCGTSHLDAVLVKLEQVAKDDLRKNSGLLSFLKDFTGDNYHEKLLATVVLSYGHVSLQAPASILTTRVETPILRSAAKFYQASKDPSVRQAMLHTVRMIADAVHPDRLQEAYTFHSRGELVTQMRVMLKAENPTIVTTTTRALVLQALASLVKLEPVLPPSERVVLVETAVSRVYSLPSKNPSLLYDEAINGDELKDYPELVILSLSALDQFLAQLLFKDRSPDNFQLMIKVLIPWLTSKQEFERERCLNSIWKLMSFYCDHIETGVFQIFSCFGFVLGLLVPRCTDPSLSIRNTALKCVQFSLEINNKSQSLSSKDDSDIHLVEELQPIIQRPDPDSLYSVTQGLAKIIAQKVQSIQLLSLTTSLMLGLTDPISQSSAGASVVLTGVIKLRGGELRAEVGHIVEDLRKQLWHIHCPKTRTGSLQIVRTLAKHHLSLVVNALLSSPLPFDEQVCDCWKALAKDPETGSNIVSHLLEMFDSREAVQEHPDPRNQKATIKVASPEVLAGVCAVQEIFRVAEMEGCTREVFGHVFSALLLVAASYVGIPPLPAQPSGDPKGATGDHSKLVPLRCTLHAFEAFLSCARQDDVVSVMSKEGHWLSMEEEELFPDSVAVLGRLICQHCPRHVPAIITSLHSSLATQKDSQRVAVVALFTEFLAQSFPGSQPLVEPLMGDVLGRLVDPCLAVRRLCIRGLAWVGRAEGDLVHRYSGTVLSAMISGMDDKDDSEQKIMLEAVNGLTTLLAQADEHDVSSFIVTVSLRLRNMFEKDKGEVRAAAFKLFGDLAKFGHGECKDAFIEQAMNNFITLLVHLNEDDRQVVKACKTTLKKLGPLLGSEEINNMFQKHLPNDSYLHYAEFINDLSKVVVNDFEEHMANFVTLCLGHLKSPQAVIQCNAALLLGFLLGNAPAEMHDSLPYDRVCAALIVLLKADTVEQRTRAAEALSLLHNY